ncbi:MAG: amidohydrolase family protein [Balneolaceae bacterium]|nr:MAG: amidohydrolase family protein [Balneolaceae bacterium]
MNIYRILSMLIAVLLLIFGADTLLAQKTIIHAGRLIDGESERVREQVSVIVEGDQITAIESGYTRAGANDVVLDLRDKTVMPGLIDLHVHLEMESTPDHYINRFIMNPADIAFQSAVYAKTTLMAGFTTVRDLGGSGVNIALRNAINSGKTVGPRVITVGKSLATTGGHADPTNNWRRDLMGDPGPFEGVVNGVPAARQAVRQRYKDGADHIKITATGGVLSVAKSGQNPQFMMDELEAIIETARDYEMHVAAHAHGKEGMLRAVEAGVLTIEHGTYMDEEVMQAMVENGTYYVPTISAGKWVGEKAKEEGYYPDLVTPKALEIGPLIQDTFSRAYKYGVRIAFGTDAGVFPHGMNGLEFGYMVEAGMPAMEAIISATSTAATVLGMQDRIGAIRAGMLADIIAVPGNPLNDIGVMTDVKFVMKDGKVYRID